MQAPSLLAIPVSDQQVAAGALLQHEGEVFAAGEWRGLRHDALGANQFGADLTGEVGSSLLLISAA